MLESIVINGENASYQHFFWVSQNVPIMHPPLGPLIFECVECTTQQKFRLVHIEGICRGQFRCCCMMEFVFDRVEKIVGNEENCPLPAFSPYPTMFSKDLFFRVTTTWDCVVKG